MCDIRFAVSYPVEIGFDRSHATTFVSSSSCISVYNVEHAFRATNPDKPNEGILLASVRYLARFFPLSFFPSASTCSSCASMIPMLGFLASFSYASPANRLRKMLTREVRAGGLLFPNLGISRSFRPHRRALHLILPTLHAFAKGGFLPCSAAISLLFTLDFAFVATDFRGRPPMQHTANPTVPSYS
jgi:hypothetical protein